MVYESKVTTRIYPGPSLLAKHPVVALAIPGSVDKAIRASELTDLLAPTPAGRFIRALGTQDGTIKCADATAALTQAMLAAGGMGGLDVDILTGPGRQPVIIARYYDPMASSYALKASFEILQGLFMRYGNRAAAAAKISTWWAQAVKTLSSYAPDYAASSLIKAAEARNIPYRVMASFSRIWLFGHGSRSVQFSEVVTPKNGVPGIILAKNKMHANRIISSLGFPTTRCGVANSLGLAKSMAKSLGYPVVVKPIDGGKGKGVTANISNEAEFEAAFKKTASGAVPAVLVENHVSGNDYRISVFSGRFESAIKRTPAQVTGDGKLSIQQLIDQENRRRKEPEVLKFTMESIVIDGELVRVISKQGYSLDNCPPVGATVLLSTVANNSAGGTVDDCTSDVHPDNITMAECITRNFRLASAGIDFISPDIGKSWRSCACAVIEVNGIPGIFSLEQAKRVLEREISGQSDGRIPIILALDCKAPNLRHVLDELAANRDGLGYVDAHTCKIDSDFRGDLLTDMGDKVIALLSDPACNALLIGVTTGDIEANGLPVDKCAVTLIASQSEMPEQVKAVIEQASGSVIDVSCFADFTDKGFGEVLTRLKEIQRG